MPVLRSRTVKEPLASRLFFPFTEGAFTYRRYNAWLESLQGVRVGPLKELRVTDGPFVGLRHDVDDRLESALELGRLEHDRGVSATYFVLHTAPYYADREHVLRALLTLQDDHGHEIGWHNDLVTLRLVHGIEPAGYLARELEWLRDGGIEISGTAAHGSPYCHRLGYHNNYLFHGWDEPQPGFPRTDVGPKLDPADYGLEYEAYHLPYDRYVSDSRFENGRRAHPATFDPRDGDARAVVLVHPCHWDRSRASKSVRLIQKVGARVRTAARRSPSTSAL
jgi:hypothetical protein